MGVGNDVPATGSARSFIGYPIAGRESIRKGTNDEVKAMCRDHLQL